MPTPIVEAIKIRIEARISYQGTLLIQMRVNIHIDEVKGMKEHTLINVLFISPPVIENIATMKAIIKRKVMGITEVLISSSFEAVEPIAP